MQKITLIILTLIAVFVSLSAYGTTLYVDGKDGDDENDGLSWETAKRTIHAGIDDALPGDTVLVKYGTYNITSSIDFGGKNLKLASDDGTHTSYETAAPDAEKCIIDAQQKCRVFYFHSGEDSDAVIDGFTIQKGRAYTGGDFGGGVYCYNSSPTLTNCTITDNVAADGGGFCCRSSSPTLTNCTITGNKPGLPGANIGDGGGFCCYESSPTLTNCTITGNSAYNNGGGFCSYTSSPTLSPTLTNCTITDNSAGDAGGGFYCYNSSPTLTNCTITGNDVSAFGGGGFYCVSSSSPTLTNCTITGNSVGKYTGGGDAGGGFYCGSSSPTLTNCTITNNLANYGGGFYCVSSSSPTLTNCTITGNSADGTDASGGGFYCGSSSPTLTNCTITNNLADSGCGIYCYGGGFYCVSSSSPTLTNCTITGNSADGTDASGGGFYCGSSSPRLTNCILWNDSPDEIYLSDDSTILVTYSDIQGGWEGDGNIDEDPLFVDPDNGNYYLQGGSPCLSSANCEEAPDYDKDGRPRPLGSGCDMGCYEQYDGGEILIYGDVSWDSNVTAYDASLVLQYLVGLIDFELAQQQEAADVTDNGKITALDAALILQYIVGLITKFPAEPQIAAPVLATQSEQDALKKVIAQLESTVLNEEQKQLLEQLKRLVFKEPIPKKTALLQNFPNPFNPETWIPYQLSQGASVTIRIYNSNGQLIRILRLGDKNPGIYIAKDKAAYWNGRNSLGEKIASGVYYYTLIAGEFRATRKTVIMK